MTVLFQRLLPKSKDFLLSNFSLFRVLNNSSVVCVPGTVKIASPTARTSPVAVVPDMMTVCLPLDEEAVLIETGRVEPGE